MKTNRLFLAWLRCAAVLLLTFTGGLSAVAQEIEGGEAFYIYQNDGHFDGFFYDQVKQISYSRFDTLGVEHDKYVSQEIVTEDSVYRIMLTAIDSVSFVQPEIKYAKAVRFMRDEGLIDYYLSAVKNGEDEIIVTFRSAMPASLRPKVGDVLQCPNLEGWEEGTLVAKVKKVSESGSVLTVTCGYVEDLKDVFEQFITVEQVRNVETPQGSRTFRRVAGINAPRRVEDNISDFTLFNFSHTFEAKAKITEKLKMQMTLNVGFGMTLSAAYKITLSEFYIKASAKYQTAVGGSIGLDGELYDNPELSSLPGIGEFVKRFTRIPFPANFPILLLHGMPEPFARAEAHLNIGVGWAAQAQASSFTLEMKDTKPYLDIKMSKVAPFLPFNSETESGFSINVQLNGSVQSGLKFPLKISSQDWFKKIAYTETGVSIYAGPKLSGVLNFDALKTMQGKGMYESLKESKIELSLMSIDAEAEGKIRFLGVDWDTKHTKSWVYGTTSYLLLPQFGDVSYQIIGDNLDEIQCSCDLSGLTCLPETVGMGIYCKENEGDNDFSKLYDSFFMPDVIWYNDNINKVEGGFTKVDPGEYRLRPIISAPGLGGLEKLLIPVYDKEVAVTIEQKGFKMEPEEGIFEEEGGEMTVRLSTRESMPITATPNVDWIKVEVAQPVPAQGGGSMKIKVDPNNEDRFRQGAITVKQGSGAGSGDEKTFVVKQYGGLQLSVNKLDFDPDGGTGVVEIFTSMKPITINVQGGADWLNYDLDDRKLTITTSENKAGQRTAVVVIAAWSAKYQGISSLKLTVTQKGLVDAVVEPSVLNFEATGGTQRVNMLLGQNTTFNDVIVSQKDKEWIIVEKQDKYFNVTVLPNTETKERQTIIDCSVTTTGADGKPNTILLPVTITQTFGTASVQPSEVHFTAEGGSQDVKVDVSAYPYCGVMIGAEGKGWVDATVSTNGVVTIKVQPNAGTQQRECTVQCYVSGVKDPAEDQMIKLPVKVVQIGRSFPPVTPDGDKSPFSYINFVVKRLVGYESALEGARDTVFQIMPGFSFTPKNAHFTVSYGKKINHYECVGYEESANDQKTRCTLSFDIEKKTKKVKNLRFTLDNETLMPMHLLPGVTSNTTLNMSVVASAGDIPLETSSSTYKQAKYTVADGLYFYDFNSVVDMNTTFTLSELGKELYGDEDVDPVSDHITYPPIGDLGDYIELHVAYKTGQGEPIDMEWPSDAVMAGLKSAGLPVYEGDTPPTLEGTYSLSAPTLVADKVGVAEQLESIDNIVLRFSGQDDSQINVDMYFVVDGVATPADSGQQALISGKGQEFSVCIPDGYGSATIISGVVDNGAISDLYYSTTSMTNKGEYLILKDGNGSSPKSSWSPGTDDWE